MPKFCKKPVEVEAWPARDLMHAAANNWDALPQCVQDAYENPGEGVGAWVFAADGIYIPTLEGNHKANPDDMIIRVVNGEFYPCKPDIFAKTYDPA